MKAKVYKKSHNRWIVRLHWKGQDYRRQMWDKENGVPLKHPELARIICDAVNHDIKVSGKYFDPKKWFGHDQHLLRFDRYAEKWLPKQKHYAPSYLPDVERYVLKAMIPFFGDSDLREIRKGQLKDFQDGLLDNYAPKTTKNIMNLLHKIFADAFDDELILRVPPFPKLTVPEAEIIWLAQETVYEIIAAIPERHQPIYLFGYFFALRPGEARALLWDCVDWEKELVIIKRTFSASVLREHTKTSRVRNLPLMEEAATILRPIRGISGHVFRTPQGRPYRGQALTKMWREATAKINAPAVILYNGIRHSRAMHLLNVDKWPMEDVRALLGHTREEMTRRYAQASAEGLRRSYGTTRIPTVDDDTRQRSRGTD
jgi:integrase